MKYDARILVLKKDVTFNERVGIAEIPTENEDCKQLGKDMDVTGWGLDSVEFQDEIFKEHDKLWTVKQECLRNSLCEANTDGIPFQEDSMICIGDEQTPANSACSEDSGGESIEFVGCEYLYI